MENRLNFKISSGLKNIIGRDLITDDFIAIFELVKNAYDAHATRVIIDFVNILGSDSKIIISDNGKGMNYNDLLNKWLFVAYSAKKDGSEDFDYRDKIQGKIFYAGAKGIGRFSCDKLGSKLKLISTKDEENSKTEQILVDWDNFEQNAKDEFINIGVSHSTLLSNPSEFRSGTILEISGIRDESEWNPEKILKLKNSLSKLINPFESNNIRDFEIEIIANDFKNWDNEQSSENRKVNGLVKNNLLNLLNEKTIKIKSRISEDGFKILTDIYNNGIWLFQIIEKNIEFNLLSNILIELYYLNRSAKNNFTRLMGIKSGEYGSVFLYKNGIRVYPYGEPGVDQLSLDIRQQKRIGDYFGTSELIGRIEILGDNPEFKETTSRGDGLIKNNSYYQLNSYLIDKVLTKLEQFYRNIFKFGFDLEDYEDTDNLEKNIVKNILNISFDENIIEFKYNVDLIEYLIEAQEKGNSAKSLLKYIENVAKNSNDSKLFSKVKKIKNTLNDALIIADLAEEEVKEKEKELQDKVKQNIFLKSLKNEEFYELVSLMHHIGISSGIISNYIQLLTYKVENNLKIELDELREILGIFNIENQKILSISRFATKSNLKLNAEDQRLDLIEFITQYIENIASAYLDNIKVNLDFNSDDKFVTSFKPIELTMVLDNLINNSKKAGASLINLKLEILDKNLLLYFKDNGIGIPNSNKRKIFDFGFTTTNGSGLGLTHVKESLQKMNADISLVNISKGQTTFLIKFI